MVSLKSFNISNGQIISHDLQLEKDNVLLVSGADEVVERVLGFLLFYKGEWPYNLSLGIDYKTHRTRPETEYALIRRDIIGKLNKIEGVSSINLFTITLDKDSRLLNISLSLNVIGSDEEVSLQTTV